MKQIINPHCHSDYSLDGAASVKQIVKRQKELGAKYAALTDHGNINGAMAHFESCKKEGILPILGIELYVQSPFVDAYRKKLEYEINEEDAEKKRTKVEKKLKESYHHLTVHFKDLEAYNYFCKLTPTMESRAVVRFSERKPIATLEELSAISGHITICSSCLVGIVQSWVIPFRNKQGELQINDLDTAEKAYLMIRDIAGKENFFVEVFPHRITHDWVAPKADKESGKILEPGHFVPIGCGNIVLDGDIQRVANDFVIAMANKYKDPILVSLDSHYALKSQKLVQDAKLGNGKEQWKFYNSYELLSSEECFNELKAMHGIDLKTFEGWVDNSYKFASLFDNFALPTSKDRWILNPMEDNFMEPLKQKIAKYGRMNWQDEEMVRRLKNEISVLAYNGKINLLSYFFTVEDIANWCKDNGILLNVRGSSAGSLLLYLLGVSAVNPLKHDLSFERFLTLGRIKANTLPDVDMDVATGGRDKLIEYLMDKYGDNFCRISIDVQLKLKSSIKDAERTQLGAVRPETEILCKSIPLPPQGVNDSDWVFGYTDDNGDYHRGFFEDSEKLQAYAKENPALWSQIKEMLGVIRQKSSHPCGCVIADKPVQEYCPIMVVAKERVTGFSPKSIESAGLVKYDILGLNTLRDISLCLKAIKERYGIAIDPWNLPYDPAIFDEFKRGNTETVFQFNTQTVKPYLVEIKPSTIDELAAITALCRPGTLDAVDESGRTLAEVYVARCNGEEVQYVHPDLEPITGDTKGVQLYQEQTIRIFRDIAGYTAEEAESVRRGIGKKDASVLREATGKLKEQCLARGWSEQQVDTLVQQIMASSRYSFNKSHAVAYSYVAYTCMYLKVKHPLEWWKSILTNADKDEIASKFWQYVSSFTDLPSVHNLTDEYQIVGDRIIAPISILKGVGEKAYTQIISMSPYGSIKDFITKNLGKREGSRSAVNSSVVQRMAVSGVLDTLFEDPSITVEQKLYEIEKIKAECKGGKVKPVDPAFIGITAWGRYLAKKQIIDVYSEDLRPILLPHRGCQLVKGGFWKAQDGIFIVSGQNLQYLKDKTSIGMAQPCVVAVVAYIVDEKIINYKNKTKRATKMFCDINGSFFEEILWPAYKTDEAPSGFKGLPVRIQYEFTMDRYFVKSVAPLIDRSKIELYNVV